jgi:hypothetical protein
MVTSCSFFSLQTRFKDLNFSVVRRHVPFLADITMDQLMRVVVESEAF